MKKPTSVERGADQRGPNGQVTKDSRPARRPLLLIVEPPWSGWAWCDRCDCWEPAGHRHSLNWWAVGGIVAGLVVWALVGWGLYRLAVR